MRWPLSTEEMREPVAWLSRSFWAVGTKAGMCSVCLRSREACTAGLGVRTGKQ